MVEDQQTESHKQQYYGSALLSLTLNEIRPGGIAIRLGLPPNCTSQPTSNWERSTQLKPCERQSSQWEQSYVSSTVRLPCENFLAGLPCENATRQCLARISPKNLHPLRASLTSVPYGSRVRESRSNPMQLIARIDA